MKSILDFFIMLLFVLYILLAVSPKDVQSKHLFIYCFKNIKKCENYIISKPWKQYLPKSFVSC